MNATGILHLLIDHYWKEVQSETSLSDLNSEDDWFDALIHFINYAYERNVPNVAQTYREAAKKAVDVLKNRQNWSKQIQ